MSIVRRTIAVVSVLSCALVLCAAAVILYDNLSASIDDSDQINSGLYDSFSTGSTAATLTDVKVVLSNGAVNNDIVSPAGSPKAAARTSRASQHSRRSTASRSKVARPMVLVESTFTVALFADSGTLPGALLATLGTMSDSVLTGTPTVYDFPLATPYVLAAHTRYWIGVTSANGSSAQWAYSADVSGIGVANEFFSNGEEAVPNSKEPYLMRLTANGQSAPPPVPLPPSVVLMLTGMAGVALYYARRRFAASR